MNYKNAVVLAVCKRLIGWVLLITGMLSTLVSILKFLSLHIDNGSMAAAFWPTRTSSFISLFTAKPIF